VTNAAEKIARYEALLAKWSELVKDVSTPAELAELRFAEIWDKIDYSKYGL
jgi:hypothetical protein